MAGLPPVCEIPRKMYSLNSPTFAVNVCSGGGGVAGAAGACANAGGTNAADSASAVTQVAQSSLIVGFPVVCGQDESHAALHAVCPNAKDPTDERVGSLATRQAGPV